MAKQPSISSDPDLYPFPTRYEPVRHPQFRGSNWEDDEFSWTEEPELDPTRPSDDELIPREDRDALG